MVAPTTTTFGALLRRHRLAAGLTQEALAERAGLSVYGIQKLERGTTRPYRDTAARLASALELASDDLDRFRASVKPVRVHGRRKQDALNGERHDNLTAALTSFVGRQRELSSVQSALRTNRLVTLTGAGGSGKTRLAIEVARCLVGEYRDGVWLVELAAIVHRERVASAVAHALGVRENPAQPLAHSIATALANQRILIVLDNCEHLLVPCAQLADQLLRACPGLRI
ncbi:MAG: XRE family transcriptional regulator [Chloroflexi bacterium]|nr:XRE family transcriptional regulator [Chloroflexota bacterium]